MPSRRNNGLFVGEIKKGSYTHKKLISGGGGEGSEVARLNRLHLISSSLSLCGNLSSSSLSSCSTPPHCHSLGDLVEGGEHRVRRSLPVAITSSITHHERSSRQVRLNDTTSSVPLEPREHAWMVKGATGAWPDIYSLFREDSSLLNKQDFISGFTVLHWIAKHGDHRVLNTLCTELLSWASVSGMGSTCGYTPLHIAAIHGNKNIIRLLVNKFHADVKLRDMAGKKPWQYLSCTTPLEIFQLLGAPIRAALGGDTGMCTSEFKDSNRDDATVFEPCCTHIMVASLKRSPADCKGA
uniref:Sosondowah ankyrin repeat domain family d n=1 Tax=Mastacembelus armatus TaxID=205130 RepID=A0A7N8WUB1_9TELE